MPLRAGTRLGPYVVSGLRWEDGSIATIPATLRQKIGRYLRGFSANAIMPLAGVVWVPGAAPPPRLAIIATY